MSGIRNVALLIAAGWSALSFAAEDNPFETSAERAGKASPSAATSADAAASDNPFLTSDEAVRKRPLIDDEPFDVVVLKERPPREMEVLPIDFPGRLPPAVKPDLGQLKVRPRDVPGEEFVVPWKDVIEVRLFEDRALAEARACAATGRFDEAFEIAAFLRKRYQHTRGLSNAEQTMIASEARHELELGRAENAYSLVNRLRTLNDGHPELPDVFARTVEKLVQERLQTGRLAAARVGLEQLSSAFPNHPITAKLKTELAKQTAERTEQARQESAAGHEGAAQTLLKEALALTPSSTEAQALYEKSFAAAPSILVGVVEPYLPSDSVGRSASWADWPQLRTERVLRPPPLDPESVDVRGSRIEYRAGWLTWTPDEVDFAAGTISIVDENAGVDSSKLGAALLRAAIPTEPTYSAQWAARQSTLSIIDAKSVALRFEVPHPRPEALICQLVDRLTIAGAPPASERNFGRRLEHDGADIRLARRDQSKSPDVVERVFADEDAALEALLAGKIDVVDRLAPWQVAGLRNNREIQLVRYAPLSVHCLLFQPRQEILMQAEFRRALFYALDREAILKGHLKASDEAQGTRVARGIFSGGRSPDDPLGYAGQVPVSSRGYEAQAAFILSRLAIAGEGNATSERQAGPPSAVSLTLAHPPTATAERACRQIRTYWARIGVDVRLRRYDEADLADADVVYRTFVVPEPIVAGCELFGPQGPMSGLGFLSDAVRQLADAENFETARGALSELQRSAHDQALMLPLWQINEYAARRATLTFGSSVAPFWLYQNVDAWQFASAAEGRKP